MMVGYVERTVDEWIAFAAERGEAAMGEALELTPDNFVMIDGGLTVDGMDPGEWIDAMLMD